jgi:predicted nucleic acid-binding protein
MSFVLDASIAAAWFLPEEQNDAADQLMADLRSASAFVPSLFWFETRNLFLMAERRGRLQPGEARLLMSQLRGFPLEDMGSVGDGSVLDLAARHMLSAYDASYLALAAGQAVALATADRRLAAVARSEGIAVRGPLAHEQ